MEFIFTLAVSLVVTMKNLPLILKVFKVLNLNFVGFFGSAFLVMYMHTVLAQCPTFGRLAGVQ